MADEIVKVFNRGVSRGDNFAAANAKFAELDAAIAGLEQDFAELPDSFDYLPLAGGTMNVGAMINFAAQQSTNYVHASISETGMIISHQPENDKDTGIGTTILDKYVSVQYHNGLFPMELVMRPTELEFKQYGSTTNLHASIGVPDTIVSGETYNIYLPNNSGTIALLSDVESALASAGKIDAITVGGKSVPIENKTAKINVSTDITVTEDTTNKTLTLSVPELANKATSLELSVDTTTYVLTAKLKKADGTALSTQTVDLPLETMVVNAEYDDLTKEIVLTLQNGTTTKFSVADLVSGLVSTETFNTTLENYLPLSGGNMNTDSSVKFVTSDESYVEIGYLSTYKETGVHVSSSDTTNIKYDTRLSDDVIIMNSDGSVAGTSSFTSMISATSYFLRRDEPSGTIYQISINAVDGIEWRSGSSTSPITSLKPKAFPSENVEVIMPSKSGTLVIDKNAFGEYTAAVSATTAGTDGTYTQTFTSTTQKLRPLFVLNASNKMVDVDWEMVENGWKLISDVSLTGTAYFASMTI